MRVQVINNPSLTPKLLTFDELKVGTGYRLSDTSGRHINIGGVYFRLSNDTGRLVYLRPDGSIVTSTDRNSANANNHRFVEVDVTITISEGS